MAAGAPSRPPSGIVCLRSVFEKLMKRRVPCVTLGAPNQHKTTNAKAKFSLILTYQIVEIDLSLIRPQSLLDIIIFCRFARGIPPLTEGRSLGTRSSPSRFELSVKRPQRKHTCKWSSDATLPPLGPLKVGRFVRNRSRMPNFGPH